MATREPGGQVRMGADENPIGCTESGGCPSPGLYGYVAETLSLSSIMTVECISTVSSGSLSQRTDPV